MRVRASEVSLTVMLAPPPVGAVGINGDQAHFEHPARAIRLPPSRPQDASAFADASADRRSFSGGSSASLAVALAEAESRIPRLRYGNSSFGCIAAYV